MPTARLLLVRALQWISFNMSGMVRDSCCQGPVKGMGTSPLPPCAQNDWQIDTTEWLILRNFAGAGKNQYKF